MQFTDQEYDQLTEILQFYREHQEELYDHPDPETLFTKAQRSLFKKFEIYSYKVNRK